TAGSRRRRVRAGAHDQAGGGLRRRPDGAQGPSHGPRRRDHLGLRRHGRREGGDHAVGGAHRGAQPRGAWRRGRAGVAAPGVAARVGPAVTTARGLVVTNTPDVLTDDTADDAVMLMLMVGRRAGEGERHVRAGAWTGWRPTQMLGTKVSGKTLGLIGMGRIGRAVARRAHHGFGMRVIFHDPYPPPAELVAELGAEAKRTVEDVLLLPHLGSATQETRVAMGLRALENLKAFFSGAAPRDRVV